MTLDEPVPDVPGEVLDELYALAPEEFTAARDARARRERQAGRRDVAARIARLRRPTVAAWAGNLLVRARPGEADRFAALGEELRRAQHDLDAAALHDLTARQRHLVAALSQEARRLAADAGRHVGEAAQRDVERTLLAVLADPAAAAAWRAGHLSRPLPAPEGLPGVAAGTRDTQDHRPEREAREARRAAEAAERDLAARRRRREEAEAARDRAATRRDDLARDLAAAEEALRAAAAAARDAGAAEADARARAEEAARRAERAAAPPG